MQKLISIVVPVFNEQDNLANFHRTVTTVIKPLQATYEFELIFVDDGSRDNSWQCITNLCLQDPQVRGLKLSRNFGHQIALSAGYDHAQGDAAISLDADLQHPPALIPEMITAWEKGSFVVCARRTDWSDSWLKKSTASLYYLVLERIAYISVQRGVGDFRLVDKQVLTILQQSKEQTVFLRGMVAWCGFPKTFIDYKCPARQHGKSGYSWQKMVRLALDGIIGFSRLLVKIPAITGGIAGLTALALALTGTQINTTALCVGLFAIQSCFVWILLEYVSRAYEASRGRPLYIIEQNTNEKFPMVHTQKKERHVSSTRI
jgi:glycosyltransferase involved in cell wall biosynthesis